MGLPKEWFIGGDLSRPNYKPPFQVGWVPREPAVGEYLQHPHVVDAEGRIVSFGKPKGQDSLFSSREDAEEAVRLLRLGKSYEDINIRDPGEKKAERKAKSALRRDSHVFAPIPERVFIRGTEEAIGAGLFYIGQTNPELAALIEEKIVKNLIGLDPEKREERVEAIGQLAGLPKEANPLKELIAYRFSLHPGDEEREASLLLIPSVTEEEKRKALLQRVIDWDPNEEIVAKAKALLGK